MHIDLHNKSPTETTGIPIAGDANTTEIHNHNLMHGAPSKELGCGITGKAEGKTASSGSFTDVTSGGKSNKSNKGKGKNKNTNGGSKNDLSMKEGTESSQTHTTGSKNDLSMKEGTGSSQTHTAGSKNGLSMKEGAGSSQTHTAGSKNGLSMKEGAGSSQTHTGGSKNGLSMKEGAGSSQTHTAGSKNDLSMKEGAGSSQTHKTGSTGASHTHTIGSTGAANIHSSGSTGSHTHTHGSSTGISVGGISKNIATNETAMGGSVASGTYNSNHKEPCQETSNNVSSFLRNDGQTNTTVHETVKPAVVKEHVTTTQHDENQRVIDREIHQDHHHTTVQPIRDEAYVPATHAHAVANKETREFRHGNDQRIHQALEAEQAQFRDTTDVGAQLHTSSMSKTVAGEHVHHHVHENIQPVIERNVHQAHVLHTTHPVHEIHHNESMHHTASVLPEISLSDFKAQGGSFKGGACKSDAFKGAPRSVDESINATHTTVLGGEGAKGTTTVTGNWGSSTDKSNAASIHSRRDSGQCSCIDTTACNGMCGRANNKVHHRANGVACDMSKMNISSCEGTTESSSCGGMESTMSKSSTKGKKKN